MTATLSIVGLARYVGAVSWLAPLMGFLGGASGAALWTGLLLLAYRARPDLDAADLAASAVRYRVFLGRAAKAVLALVACVNLSLLLSALRTWRLLPLSGDAAAVVLAPFAAGLVTVVIVLNRAAVIAAPAGLAGILTALGNAPG